MTNNFTLRVLFCALFSLPILFNSCIKDSCQQKSTYKIFTPVFKDMDEVRADIKSNAPREVQNAGKIYIRGNYIFLNDIDRGIHVIDNSDPSAPKNVSFIGIPGNMDLAVKGNMLYADFYTELITLDISNPLDVRLSSYRPQSFPVRPYLNGFIAAADKIIVDWTVQDSVVMNACDVPNDRIVYEYMQNLNSGTNVAAVSPIGAGGSMARFTIINDRLYTVSQNSLEILDISNPGTPTHTNKVTLPWGIETIFPMGAQLFIGSQSGMFRYDVSTPDAPVSLGQFSHARTCDPVIADDKYAYVTLRSGSSCAGYTNQLDIIDLKITNPNVPMQLLVTHPMTNPHGLGKDGDLLFLCDGVAGLKVFDVSDIYRLKPLKTFTMDAYDVIAYNNRALVVAKGGLYQYDYSDKSNIRQLSKITINTKP
ncbi:MAG: hypothetical protein ABWZ25_01205 [Chitinophagaceae bacterium]